MSNSTSNDEYSARVRETDDASEQEGTLSGRPFEVRSATGGLFRGLLSDKSGVFGLVVFLHRTGRQKAPCLRRTCRRFGLMEAAVHSYSEPICRAMTCCRG